jgi:hypothetical protein
LQDMFYGNQSPCGQNCSTNIHGIQRDLPALWRTAMVDSFGCSGAYLSSQIKSRSILRSW